NWINPQIGNQSVVFEKKDLNQKKLPNVIGMGAKDAVYLLESRGLKVKIIGVGKVKKQSINDGALIKKGETITLILED
ncbi:MAG: PASTA domain-containing protein, partial [Bacteroides sp.]